MEQKSKTTLESLGELDQKELELIHLIRTKYRYGELIILTRDGLPYRVAKATEYSSLD